MIFYMRKNTRVFRFILFTIIVGLVFYSLLFFSNKQSKEHGFLKLSIDKSEPKCQALVKNNSDIYVRRKAEAWKFSANKVYNDSQLSDALQKNCQNFLRSQQYFINLPKSEEEEDFPIAFSIITFKNAFQVERLLRTIYRPWNYYCIHVDIKSDEAFFNAIEDLVGCLNSAYKNIFNTKNRVSVVWGKMSVLTADLNCMKELYERYKDWKYLINLTGQEFPLKTNAELVKILKAYKGANNLEGTYKRRNEDRITKMRIPFPIVWYKGSVHITANRDFVAFIFESPKSLVLLSSLQNTWVPDEQFFSTLNFNPQLRIRGSFIGDPDIGAPPNDPLYYFLTRYKNWGDYPCESGKFVRQICIFGVGDLPKLVTVPHLFANKFHEDFQPATLRCLETWYYEKVQKELESGVVAVNETFYSSLPFVEHRYIPPE